MVEGILQSVSQGSDFSGWVAKSNVQIHKLQTLQNLVSCV